MAQCTVYTRIRVIDVSGISRINCAYDSSILFGTDCSEIVGFPHKDRFIRSFGDDW